MGSIPKKQPIPWTRRLVAFGAISSVITFVWLAIGVLSWLSIPILHRWIPDYFTSVFVLAWACQGWWLNWVANSWYYFEFKQRWMYGNRGLVRPGIHSAVLQSPLVIALPIWLIRDGYPDEAIFVVVALGTLSLLITAWALWCTKTASFRIMCLLWQSNDRSVGGPQ